MDYEQFRRRLRIATAGDDAAATMAVLDATMPVEGLQICGQALRRLVLSQPGDAAALAEQCSAALRERGWSGDDQLADELDSALGRREPPALPAVPVDLEEIGDALSSQPGDDPGVLDVETGEFWPPMPPGFEDDFSDIKPPEPDGTRTLAVWPEGSSDAYSDMQQFIATVQDDDLAERLANAIRGSGAFRRFRDVLYRHEHEFSRWQLYSDDRRVGRAREWLADAGYQAATHPRTPSQ